MKIGHKQFFMLNCIIRQLLSRTLYCRLAPPPWPLPPFRSDVYTPLAWDKKHKRELRLVESWPQSWGGVGLKNDVLSVTVWPRLIRQRWERFLVKLCGREERGLTHYIHQVLKCKEFLNTALNWRHQLDKSQKTMRRGDCNEERVEQGYKKKKQAFV